MEAEAKAVSQRARMNELLGWKTGQFEFAASEVTGPDLLQCSLMGLLLEHARLSDEGARTG